MTTISDVKSQDKALSRATPRSFVIGLILSALSGVMLLLAFPPYGIWWLAWFAFVPGIFAQYRLFPVKYASLGSGEGTLYTSLGDILGWVMLAGLVAFIIYQIVAMRQAKKGAKRQVVIETS